MPWPIRPARPARASPRRRRRRRADADWASPPRLAREGLIGLTRALAAAGPSWRLDWSALDAIEPDAAGPLRALFNHWADSTVQLRFRGADRLLLVLAEATPANDRGVDAVWWQLHMAALRVMHRGDEFELLALNYCITYEVSPPPWEDPKGDFASLDAALPATPPARPSLRRRRAGGGRRAGAWPQPAGRRPDRGVALDLAAPGRRTGRSGVARGVLRARWSGSISPPPAPCSTG